MAREIIAQIKLAPGQIGYYDEYSRIHLTVGEPIANVYSGTNCAQLRRSVRSGRIILLNGSLGEHVPPFKVLTTPDGNFVLASNAEEEHKPVLSVVPPIKATHIPEVKEEPVESAKEEKADEVVEEPAVVEETTEVEEPVKEEVQEEQEGKAKSKKAKKATPKK